MNRVGDVGLALAIFLMFATLGTTSLRRRLRPASARSAGGTVTAIGLLLLLGACGKSGQFPLQAWLPDAMEGPTPVSALIHAATMVTAGVYLIARSAPIFDAHRDRPHRRHDRRRAHAADRRASSAAPTTTSRRCWPTRRSARSATCSWPSASARPATRWASSHLLAHGFFKAGLFLGAGSVMHGMNDQVDMRRFGGLWKDMPITLVDLRPRLPRDHRLPAVLRLLHQGHDHRGGVRPGRDRRATLLGIAALLGAGLTAFYMTRLFVMTFHGKRRWSDGRRTRTSRRRS